MNSCFSMRLIDTYNEMWLIALAMGRSEYLAAVKNNGRSKKQQPNEDLNVFVIYFQKTAKSFS